MSQTRCIVYPDADPSTVDLLKGPLWDRLEALGTFTCHVGAPIDDEEFSARVGDAEAIILGHWTITDTALGACPSLKCIAYTGVGIGSQVNLELASELGILTSITPGCSTQSVAEHTIALMLAAARQIPVLDARFKSGGWSQVESAFDLHGKTLGLVGLGSIAKRTAELVRAFGMDVIAWTAHPSEQRAREAGVRFESLEAVLESSDVVSLHLPLTPETEGLITANRLSRIRDGALLINTARGEIVNEPALIEALKSGRISAGLDVFHQEPLAGDHPFRQLENVIITPHTAYNTPEANLAIFESVVANLEAYCAGDPINIANR